MINFKIYARNAFNGLLQNYINSFEENENLEKIRKDYLKRTCFLGWFKSIGSLKEEKNEQESLDQYDEIISSFRSVKNG